jgi:hypothetical protein
VLPDYFVEDIVDILLNLSKAAPNVGTSLSSSWPDCQQKLYKLSKAEQHNSMSKAGASCRRDWRSIWHLLPAVSGIISLLCSGMSCMCGASDMRSALLAPCFTSPGGLINMFGGCHLIILHKQPGMCLLLYTAGAGDDERPH